MTLSGDRKRPEKRSPKYPWIIPAVVALAIVIIVVGIFVATSMGIKLF
jgi:hypothetical protein